MKRYAKDFYLCPFSGENLNLQVIEAFTIDLTSNQISKLNEYGIDPAAAATVIKEGFLYSETGGYWFPIINCVPIFLDFHVDLYDSFREKHIKSYSLLDALKCPDGEPRPGERFVQDSFTREWALLELGSLSFGITGEQRDFFISLELDWPEKFLQRTGLKVLDLGCGSGFESQSLYRVTQSMIFGFDLNLSLLKNGHALAREPFINNAICSLYRLPVAKKSWDVVYSSGCLHHTHSTRAAFAEALTYKKEDGLIYIWIYAREDADYSIPARIDWLIEDIVRPRLAKLPVFWQNLVVKVLAYRHYRRYKKLGGYNPDKWKLKDSEHFIRDRWTALYAHRQSFNDVMRWFSDVNLDYRLIDPKKYFDYFNWPLIGIGIRGINAKARQSKEKEASDQKAA